MDILLLLVGSNPLPVYITARYLLDKNRKDTNEPGMQKPERVIFVFSSGENGTKIFRDKVQAQLENEGFKHDLFENCDRRIDLREEMRNYGKVYEEIKKVLETYKDQGIRVQLGYSGGTKTMVVAAAQAVQKFCNDNKSEFSFIDIDPANDRLMVSCNGELQTNLYPKIRLNMFFRDVELTLTDIFKLHDRLEYDDYKEVSGNTEFFKKLYENDKDLYQLLSDESFKNCWHEHWYCCKYKNCEKYNRNKKIFNNYKKEIMQTFNKKEIMQMFMQEFIEDISQKNPKYSKLFEFLPVPDLAKDKLKHIIRLLDGVWLEEAVLKALDDIKIGGEKYFDELRSNMEARLDGNTFFEVDVLARRGCQVCLFSCTTDDTKEICKKKAFEAYMRSQQLGGEHARFCLVCMIEGKEDLDKIKKHLDHFEASQNFVIVGRSALVSHETLRDAFIKALKIE